MKIKLLKEVESPLITYRKKVFPKGSVIDIADEIAKQWVDEKKAKPVVEVKTEFEQSEKR